MKLFLTTLTLCCLVTTTFAAHTGPRPAADARVKSGWVSAQSSSSHHTVKKSAVKLAPAREIQKGGKGFGKFDGDRN